MGEARELELRDIIQTIGSIEDVVSVQPLCPGCKEPLKFVGGERWMCYEHDEPVQFNSIPPPEELGL